MNVRELLILSRIPGVGPGRLSALVTAFGDPARVRKATARELIRVEGIEQKTATHILNFYRGAGVGEAERWAEDQLRRLERRGGSLVSLWSPEYPTLLKKIYDPPSFLFTCGDLTEADARAIAIVGTRGPSQYGIRMAQEFAGELARQGFTIVSGLARGIDSVAHTAALRAGGRTVAVIGSGVDVIYPPENRTLVDRLVTSGALLSEFPMQAQPDAVNFPRRNRIVSGMTLGTLVVETGVDGGAMITAALALDQNREVFAIPGPITGKTRSGTHLLIKEGKAALVESVDDILAEFAPQGKRTSTPSTPLQELTLFEQRVFDAVPDHPEHVDSIASRSGLTVSDTLVHMLSLELKSAVRQHPGKLFSRI
jgi:DNA processing protein